MARSVLTDDEVKESLDKGGQMWTATEVAMLMKRKPATVRMWFKTGTMRSVKSGSMWYTTIEEVRRYISDGPFKKE